MATKPQDTRNEILNTYPSNNLLAQTQEATPNAKGFVSTMTINPAATSIELKAVNNSADNFVFCLRPINDKAKYIVDCEDADVSHSVLCSLEATSIMSESSSGGSGLHLMPLFCASSSADIKSNVEGTKQATLAVKQLSHIGLPLGVTLWLDMQSISDIGFVNNAEKRDHSNFVNAFVTKINEAGYSVGFYSGNVAASDCESCCDSDDAVSNTVLQTVKCFANFNVLVKHNYKFISIGLQNNDSCKVRWAYFE